MLDKTQQKTTEKGNVNPETGLTPQQEQAAMLLAAGETITSVATKMNLNRCTLYEWQKLLTYQCFLNKQISDYRDNLRNGLYSLANEALQTIRECLNSRNEGNRLKTAMWLVEKINDANTGGTDARAVIREQCTKNTFNFDTSLFDEKEYKNLLLWYGLKPD